MNKFYFPQKELEEFCLKNRIKQLAVFGSVFSKDFNEYSDIDILYSFNENVSNSLYDIVRMKSELEKILSHPVDFISRNAVEKSNNNFRKKSILDNLKVIYES
jgi:predicted nucleotidyltransferase